MLLEFRPDEAFAHALDQTDELAGFRDCFHLPVNPTTGTPQLYFCGHSLGLQPKTVRQSVLDELDRWAALGVAGHFTPPRPWADYDADLRPLVAELVGAQPDEVAVANGLTVNLHLLMASFYRPTRERFKILIEARAFPSDRYAAASQAAFHGFDPREAVVEIRPRPNEDLLRTDDILEYLEREGETTALVLLGAVNYATGQFFDIAPIVSLAHAKGCVVCIDAAHAIGNVPLALHDWDVDCAVWCHYKYVNAGPGAVGGFFVHARHARRFDLPRFVGWWGHRADTRFLMPDAYELAPGAAGWQLSNLPILSMAALRASLEIFHQAQMARLRAKSMRLTAYLLALLGDKGPALISPRDPAARGGQLSWRVAKPRQLADHLLSQDVIVDVREPDIIRLAVAPLYNSFHDVWRLAAIWRNLTEASGVK
ncbi:MAG: kynureninase [Chloracidobacterium sp.]|nr:kynureninase [Chloracidobacterium sp.]MDW8218201.1 kynureninase [Acidobacteriota bacterium]